MNSGENPIQGVLEESRIEQRQQILERLQEEQEWELVEKLEKCGKEWVLQCVNCGSHREVKTKCKRKWCPVCVRAIAAKRSAKMLKATARFEWPLFVTLTRPNTDDMNPEVIRGMRRAFGKLRHRKIWKDTVKGGVAAIEVTNIGNGWHPHLHALLDCEWLAIKTAKPNWKWGKERKKEAYEAANRELGAAWAKSQGLETAFVRAKRASLGSIAKEVCKYAVKGADMIACEGSLGDLIRAIDSTRLVTTFGSVFGMKIEEDKHVCECEKCGPHAAWMPAELCRAVYNGAVRAMGNTRVSHHPQEVA